ncbi:acetyl-CoA synthetase-like protein [Gigaspora margarita]|uniref:Acetyl-CoA synthetase-like protein n=1 Tax=Gigaspora margarita TaxID=4874 RepID=A0A8H4A2Y6_GIGMA|nr:acetyl-CoA synthetase-like protein [Gigaspora margarita]
MNVPILLFGDKEINGYKPYHSELIKEYEIEPVVYTQEEAKTTTAYLCYSSGTTGKQKGVEITHRNVVTNLTQIINIEQDFGSHSIFMGVLPFYHNYALLCSVHLTLICGATTIVLPDFDVEIFCRCIEKYKINYIHAVPPIILRLVKDPIVRKYDLSSVKMIVSGAVSLGYELERVFFTLFRIPIKQAFGSCGILLQSMEAKIISDDGDDLGPNKPGELCVRGPNIMKGYLNNRDATNAAFDKDGFLYTGDIAYVDDQGL